MKLLLLTTLLFSSLASATYINIEEDGSYQLVANNSFFSYAELDQQVPTMQTFAHTWNKNRFEVNIFSKCELTENGTFDGPYYWCQGATIHVMDETSSLGEVHVVRNHETRTGRVFSIINTCKPNWGREEFTRWANFEDCKLFLTEKANPENQVLLGTITYKTMEDNRSNNTKHWEFQLNPSFPAPVFKYHAPSKGNMKIDVSNFM